MERKPRWPAYVEARSIMGPNFIGLPGDLPESLAGFFSGIDSGTHHCIPFSQKDLMSRRETHVLVALPPVSIDVISRELPRFFSHRGCSPPPIQEIGKDGVSKMTKIGSWYPEEVKSHVLANAWALVQRPEVGISVFREKSHEGQLSILGKDEEVMPVSVMAYAAIAYFLKTREAHWPLSGLSVRCREQVGERQAYLRGTSSSKGRQPCLIFSTCTPKDAFVDLGLAVGVKPQTKA